MSPPRREPSETDALRRALVDHALELIRRDGADALTMRALATEAGCAVGLPYKVFADRNELVAAILVAEFERIESARDELVRRAGTGAVGRNLAWFAEQLLDSPAVALAHEIVGDHDLSSAVADEVHGSTVGPASFEPSFVDYLRAEVGEGRVDPATDVEAVGFLLAGAVHNLVMSGDAWPRPTRRQLRRHLAAIADTIAPRG